MQTEVLFEDQDIIVAYKPTGLAVQTAKLGCQDMENELKNYLKQPFLGVVHRLDQPVEGVLVFGKTPKATAALNRQLVADDFCKEYLAAVCGKSAYKEQQLVDYLIKEGGKVGFIESTDDAEKKKAKRAVLHYENLQSVNVNEKLQKPDSEIGISLFKVILQTGRFHQIRAQLSKLGNPILGDSKYGTSESTLISQALNITSVALCAHRLVFKHPVSNKRMEYSVSPKNIAFTFFKNDLR